MVEMMFKSFKICLLSVLLFGVPVSIVAQDNGVVKKKNTSIRVVDSKKKAVPKRVILKKKPKRKKIVPKKKLTRSRKIAYSTWYLNDPIALRLEVKDYDKILYLVSKRKKKLEIRLRYKMKKIPKSYQDLIKETIDIFATNDVVDFNAIDFYYDENEFSFHINPTSYKAKMDIGAYLPYGLRFYYDGRLSYDFRIFSVSKSNYIRLKGVYFGMKDLIKKVQEGVESFGEYLNQDNPNYVAKQLNYMDSEVVALEKQIEVFQKQIEMLQQQLADLQKNLAYLLDRRKSKKYVKGNRR